MTPRILVTGGSGQVGTALIEAAPEFGVEIVAPARSELELTDAAAIDGTVAAGDWAAVINCAAHTAVDKAESEPEIAFAINATAPGLLAEATGRRGIPLLHVSTDYVFDGTKAAPYSEDDPVNPVSVYGASKEAGERAVREGNPHHVILRTAWVVSPWGSNFVKTMLRLAGERDEVRVVSDQHGCPTGARDIARALLTVATRMANDPAAPSGTYHFVNAGDATWFDLALAVFDHRRAGGYPAPTAIPITTDAYPTPAKRPANSRLATNKIARDYGIAPRDWRDMVNEVLGDLDQRTGLRA